MNLNQNLSRGPVYSNSPMDKPQCLDNSQLERLAAAAATMDYTHPVVHQNSQETGVHHQVGHPDPPPHTHADQIVLDRISRPLQPQMSSMPQVISYIDPYHIPKGHHLIPVRTYDGQTFIQDQSQSRVVMVATNRTTPPPSVQFSKPMTHFVTTGIQYHSDQEAEETCTQASSSYAQVLSPNTQILHYSTAEVGEVEEPSSVSFVPDPLGDPSPGPAIELQTREVKKNLKRKICENSPIKTKENEANDLKNEDQNPQIPCTRCKTLQECGKSCKHQGKFGMPKRNGLPLELKIEIIKRIHSGERKADMAEEYGVNSSTIKSVMKKADSYLTCWKKGMFNPDTKRLKGPKREDVEEALYSWYKQSLDNDTPVSGPILCAKALDFAKKLGHTDFKPTHGWLDRFKKRKKIVFGRGASRRRRETKSQDCMTSLLPQMLIDYEATDIFAVELLGLFYRALPSAVDTLKGNKCPGGVKSKERLSLVMCSNMNGSEKFPLLVAGRYQKGLGLKNVKHLPVHHILNNEAWINAEIMTSWLLDIDSWFVQQGRKVILLAPISPVTSHPPKLRAIKFVVMPTGYPSPLKQIAVPYFKKFYRKRLLEESMVVASRSRKCPQKSNNLQLSFFSCLQLLASAWQNLTDNVIVSSFQRSGLTKYGLWMIVPHEPADVAGHQEMFLRAIHVLEDIPTPEVTFEDYLRFDDDLQVCNLMGDDDILAKVTGALQEEEDEEEGLQPESEDEDNKENNEGKLTALSCPSFVEVEKALSVLRRYIQYQEGAEEMFRVLTHLEFFIYKRIPDQTAANQLQHH